MKVLSIQQPYASLIMLGFKTIETRSWATKYRGELLIHASAGKQYKGIPDNDPFWKFYHLLFAKNKIEPIAKLPVGAILGKVTLEDTFLFTDDYVHFMNTSNSDNEQEIAFGKVNALLNARKSKPIG